MKKNIEEKDKLYPVTKGNQLIQNSRYNLTLQQQKLVAYTISKIKPNQDKFEWMDISVQDFNSLCGKTGNPGSNDYVIFRDSIMGLSETFFLEEIETEEDGTAKRDKNGNYIKKTTNVNWIDFELEERVNSKGEVVASKGKIKLNEKLSKHLIGLKGVYTSYSLQFILPMKSKFSIRLYEYLKSYSNYGDVIEIELEELKDVILSENDGVRDPNKYKKYSDFKRRVLDDAISEINRYTDTEVAIIEEKTFKRNVYALVFSVNRKVQVLDKDQTPIDVTATEPADTDVAFPALFKYSHGASKPVFRRELLKRVDISYTDKARADMWNMIAHQFANLANRHTKEDIRIDGGNVHYIDIFNDMIVKAKFEDFIRQQVEKYTSRQFENLLNEQTVYNKDAYIKGCIRNDVDNWQSFLTRSERIFYEKGIADEDQIDLFTVPDFED